MALRHCSDCSSDFAVGLEVCPQCGSGSHHELGAPQAPPDKPARSAGKPEWVAYAESVGIDTDELTKDQIIGQVDILEAE